MTDEERRVVLRLREYYERIVGSLPHRANSPMLGSIQKHIDAAKWHEKNGDAADAANEWGWAIFRLGCVFAMEAAEQVVAGETARRS